MRQLTDEELLLKCQAGDAKAWQELVERYARLVYSIARRERLEPGDCDDAFQTVFLRLMQNVDRIERPSALAGWLITTTRRACWRIASERGRSVATTQADAVAEAAEPTIEAWERHQAVNMALRDLDRRCRDLLQALYFTDPPLSYKELAARLNLREGSIGPTRARCFAALIRILEADDLFDS